MYETKEQGKEKNMSPISTIRFDSDLKTMAFDFGKREIYANNNLGVIIIDSKRGAPIKAFAAHHDVMTKI